MTKAETGKRLLELHTRYIINGEKPEAGFPRTGFRNLNLEEMREVSAAFREAPRIGRVGNGRKRENELVAVPRGLLEYYCEQASYFAYIHDQWGAGELAGNLAERKGAER